MRQQATVILVSQNEQRGYQSLHEIKKVNPVAKAVFFPCDLSNLATVRQLAATIHKQYARLDIIINNAGILPGNRQNTPEGFELSWATNHLGPFLLTNLLLDLLQKTPDGRIINVSSEAHRLGQVEFNPAMARKNYSAFTAYCDSKLANVLFTYELARRLELTPITVNALHPGIIASNFGSTGSGFLKWIFKIGRPFMQSTTQGTATILYLATSDDVKLKTGLYFKNKKPVKSSGLSYNQPLARRLWQVSEEQAGL